MNRIRKTSWLPRRPRRRSPDGCRRARSASGRPSDQRLSVPGGRCRSFRKSVAKGDRRSVEATFRGFGVRNEVLLTEALYFSDHIPPGGPLAHKLCNPHAEQENGDEGGEKYHRTDVDIGHKRHWHLALNFDVDHLAHHHDRDDHEHHGHQDDDPPHGFACQRRTGSSDWSAG